MGNTSFYLLMCICTLRFVNCLKGDAFAPLVILVTERDDHYYVYNGTFNLRYNDIKNIRCICNFDDELDYKIQWIDDHGLVINSSTEYFVDIYLSNEDYDGREIICMATSKTQVKKMSVNFFKEINYPVKATPTNVFWIVIYILCALVGGSMLLIIICKIYKCIIKKKTPEDETQVTYAELGSSKINSNLPDAHQNTEKGEICHKNVQPENECVNSNFDRCNDTDRCIDVEENKSVAMQEPRENDEISMSCEGFNDRTLDIREKEIKNESSIYTNIIKG